VDRRAPREVHPASRVARQVPTISRRPRNQPMVRRIRRTNPIRPPVPSPFRSVLSSENLSSGTLRRFASIAFINRACSSTCGSR
jgi:hypothetical protein